MLLAQAVFRWCDLECRIAGGNQPQMGSEPFSGREFIGEEDRGPLFLLDNFSEGEGTRDSQQVTEGS